MSQYYVPRPRTQRNASSSRPTRTEEESPALLNDSIYVFPNPPSDPSSSPGSSIFFASNEHELYHSTVSYLSRREASRPRSDDSFVNVSAGRHGTFSTNSPEIDVSDWATEEDVISEEFELEPDMVAGSRRGVMRMPLRPTRLQDRQLYVRSRTQSRTSVVSSCPTYRSMGDDQVDSDSPHPRVRIPLLDMIASLFSVDETTLHLLTHSTSHHGSILFPGHTISDALPQYELDDEEADTNNIHGIHKLLMSPDISSDSWTSLKRGFVVVCNTSPVQSIGIEKLWGLVNQVWVNGERAFKEVLGGAAV